MHPSTVTNPCCFHPTGTPAYFVGHCTAHTPEPFVPCPPPCVHGAGHEQDYPHMDSQGEVYNTSPAAPTVPTPHSILVAQVAEARATTHLEGAAATLLAECRTLLAVHPWQSLEFRAAVCGLENELEASQQAHQHRANVESEYERVQAAEDARIGWTIAGEVA